MVQTGVLTKLAPSESQKADIEYGFKIAKQMGGLDIGQSVVMKDKMIMAIEAKNEQVNQNQIVISARKQIEQGDKNGWSRYG